MVCRVTTPKLIGVCCQHHHQASVTAAQFAEHKISGPEIWFLTYVHPSSTISRPLKNKPLGSAHANNNLSSLYVSMLLLTKLISATAVSEAQITAENPVTKIRILYKACSISSICYFLRLGLCFLSIVFATSTIMITQISKNTIAPMLSPIGCMLGMLRGSERPILVCHLSLAKIRV